MSDALRHMAARVAADPCFLAFALAGYAAAEKLDDAGLAAALGVDEDMLTMLRLCRSPREKPAEFKEDVTKVATSFGVDASKLTGVVNAGRVFARLRDRPAVPERGGAFLAARDGEEGAP